CNCLPLSPARENVESRIKRAERDADRSGQGVDARSGLSRPRQCVALIDEDYRLDLLLRPAVGEVVEGAFGVSGRIEGSICALRQSVTRFDERALQGADSAFRRVEPIAAA